MKKILFFASVLAGFFLAASCQQESFEPEVSCNVVSYTIQVPGAIGTKAIGTDVTAVTELIYEVYRIDEQGAETKLYQKSQTRDAANGETNWTVELELVNNQDFRVLFWAQVPGNGVYTTTSLKNVTLATGLNANAENYAAFAGQDEITYGENLTGRTVTLVRPVAQLNIATSAESLKLGEDENGANPQTTVSFKTTAVTVEGLSAVYNVADQSVSATTTTFVYGATLPYDNDATTTDNLSEATIKVNNVDYQYVSMNYVGFAQPSGDNVKVTYTIETNEVGTITNTISNVPVKANYRTNIIGNLITSTSDYTVTLDAEWKDPDGGNMEVVVDGLVKNINGDYEVSTAKGLAYAINNLFVDVNGVANAKTFYVKPGLYDMAQQAINDITVTSGTLKVYDTEAVVTRSATTGSVIITGLKKALIQKVEEDATVFFSGIIVKDFNGADDAAALVQNNEGKVVLADCQILDENGAPDQDTELVGGNDPIEVEKGEEEAGELIYTAEQLAAAFADESVESIALGADIALESTLVFPADRKATLDLRGWNLTIADPDMVANTYAINNLGDLTIKDSYGIGAVTARGIYNGYDDKGEYSETAKLTIVSGTFNAMGTNGGAAVFNYGVADINGGKFESNGGYGLNNQGTGEMTIDNADVRGGVFNRGNLTVDDSKVYQHLSGKHSIYNEGSVTINGGEFDSESGNELIFADGENASVTINDGTFHKTAKSYLYSAAAGKNITFTINGGTHYGYVNQPEMTVDTFRPGAPIVVTGGSYNFDVTNWCHKDYKSVKNAETAMWDVVAKVYVAEIGEDGYESLQEAFNAVKTDNTITILKNLTDVACYYNGTASFTLDLNGKTLTSSDHTHMFEFNWNQVAESTPVTINITNGTLISGENTMWTIYSEDTNNVKGTFNLTNLTIDHNMPNYGAVVAGIGNTFNAEKVNITTSYGIGFYAAGGEVVMNDCSAAVEGLHVKPYNSMAFAVVGNGKMTIESGIYSATPVAESDAYNQGTSHGSWCGGIMNSGGTLIINGGTFSNDNFGENNLATAARGLLLADTGANIQINGGTFNALAKVIDIQNNLGDASKNPKVLLAGGNFSSDPCTYDGLISVTEGKVVLPPKKDEVYYTIGDPVVKVGNTGYGTIDEAIANWTNNTTLTLLANVTLNDVIKIKSTEHHILDLGTYTMTAKSKQNAIEITCEGQSKETYALTVNADVTNPGGITASGKACIYYNKQGTTQDRPMICVNNGVFTGSYSINVYSSNRGTNCPTVLINNGIFNSYMSVAHGKLRINGGIFHGAINCTGDSTAYREIRGGRFKSWQYMTGDASNKFWVGTAKETYDVGCYVDDEGYLVVGGPVITEFDDRFEAKAKIAAWSSYLKYSSAANGLYYTKKDNIKVSSNILELNPNKTFE